MKQIFKLSVLLIVLLFTQKSFGQINLNGKWKVKCSLEFASNLGFTYCPLCPIKMSEDKTSFSLKDFEMIFTKDSLKIITMNGITQVVYKLNNDLNTLEFKFNGETCVYRISNFWYESNRVILKDKDGLMIQLKKKKKFLF